MNYLQVITICCLIAGAFFIGKALELQSQYVTLHDCTMKQNIILSNNTKLVNEFYGFGEYDDLSSGHINAFLSHQVFQCVLGQKMFGEK